MPEVRLALFTEHGGHRIGVRVGGVRMETPPVEHLAFYAGLGILAAAEIIEWPLAVTLSVGHMLIEATRRPGLQALGEAFEAA
ncbi:MAG TPA: hypothetical protein VKD67_10225 [Acidimicrobiales bacterium]|nr:hypothetical protein [Acidimicrobiales bacterium]